MMCSGIALAYSEMPVALIKKHRLDERVHERGGEKEVRFLYREVERILPILHEGQLRIVRWGTRRENSKALPYTGWTWLKSVEAGRWGELDANEVVIPATLGHEKGIWYRIRQGIRAVLVEDEHRKPVVYMMVEPASHYYQTMTKSKRMPVLIGERI